MFLDPFPTFHIMRDASSKPDVSRASPALRHLGEPRWGAGGGKMEQPGLEMCWTMECTQIWRQGATQRHFGRNSRLTQTATPRPPPQMPTQPSGVHRWETCEQFPPSGLLPTRLRT